MVHQFLCEHFCKLNIRKSKARTYVFSLTIILALFALTPLFAQSEVQNNSSEVFQNEKLSDILTKLSKSRNLNFSYDANNPVFDKIISYKASGEETDKLLLGVLSNTGIEYKQIGNQIVLYQSQDSQAESINEQVQPGSQANDTSEKPENEIIGALTIFEYKLDTIYLMDTIIRVDTIRLTDTVFIEKVKPESQNPSKIKKIPVDFFQTSQIRDEGWAMDVFAAPLLSDFSLVNGKKTFSLRSFSLGFNAVKLMNRWNISTGLRLTQFNQRFTQQYSETEGGFYKTDTSDAYYTVVEMDTTWYYVTDSSWVPLQTIDYNYEQTNTLGCLELNISASFDVFQNQKTRVYLKAGGQVSFLIYKDGISLPDKDKGESVNFNDLQFNNINYSFLLGAGFKYRIGDKVDFYSELYYSGYLNTIVPDFPVDAKINAIGLKFGLFFYF
jgi:hypothetical protein